MVNKQRYGAFYQYYALYQWPYFIKGYQNYYFKPVYISLSPHYFI